MTNAQVLLGDNIMTRKLLITGARERPNGFELGDGKIYDAALLVRLDLDSGETETLIEKTDAGPHYPDAHPNLQFTSGCTQGSSIWLPTDTEIYKVNYPSLAIEKVISHPCFQNIHSAHILEGLLWVTSTGLDMVIAIDPRSGEILKQYNAEHKPLWHRFSPDVDYRKTHSTRPHACHPNFVFLHDAEYWVTRCTQEDAVTISTPSKRINISGTDKTISVHDGIVIGDNCYFTSVDGCLVIADILAQKVVNTIDICKRHDLGRLGWCRGLLIEDNIAYLGFSSIRRTRQSRKLSWLGDSLNRVLGKPAAIVAYDFKKDKVLRKYELRKDSLAAIYSVLPEPPRGQVI